MKRFYEDVDVTKVANGGWQVTLDGRGLHTVKGAAQIVPTERLARALAEEWAQQSEDMDTSRFVHRDQTDLAIDIVHANPEPAVDQLINFAETDTLLYRADPDEPLYSRQQDMWEPLVQCVEKARDISFTRVSGIMHRNQPEATLSTLRVWLNEQDYFQLAGLQTMASLSASLCVPLLALQEQAEPVALWRAASLEEEWQADLWGRDPQAEDRRAKRQNAFLAAFEWIQMLNE